MDQRPHVPCFQGNSYGPVALKLHQKFPPRLVGPWMALPSTNLCFCAPVSSERVDLEGQWRMQRLGAHLQGEGQSLHDCVVRLSGELPASTGRQQNSSVSFFLNMARDLPRVAVSSWLPAPDDARLLRWPFLNSRVEVRGPLVKQLINLSGHDQCNLMHLAYFQVLQGVHLYISPKELAGPLGCLYIQLQQLCDLLFRIVHALRGAEDMMTTSSRKKHHLQVRYFRNPCDRDPPTRNFQNFKFFKNSLKILSVYFWGTGVYFWGTSVYFWGTGVYFWGTSVYFGDNRGFRGFWNFFFLLLGGFGAPRVGGSRRGFENI